MLDENDEEIDLKQDFDDDGVDFAPSEQGEIVNDAEGAEGFGIEEIPDSDEDDDEFGLFDENDEDEEDYGSETLDSDDEDESFNDIASQINQFLENDEDDEY